jgi:hypothetical protein
MQERGEAALELRLLSLVARCEGGMRIGDLHKWDWTMIDRVHSLQRVIPRAPTREGWQATSARVGKGAVLNLALRADPKTS